MNCVLTKENQRQIKALIKSGRFNNRSEVLRAGLWSLMREERSYLHPPALTQKQLEEIYAPDKEADAEELAAARASSRT